MSKLALNLHTGRKETVADDDPGLWVYSIEAQMLDSETGAVIVDDRISGEYAYLMDAEFVVQLDDDAEAAHALFDHLTGSGGPLSGWDVTTMGAFVPEGEQRLLRMLNPSVMVEDAAEAYEQVEDLLAQRFAGYPR